VGRHHLDPEASRLRTARPALALLYQLVVSAPLLLLASVLLREGFAVSPTPLVVAAFLYQGGGRGRGQLPRLVLADRAPLHLAPVRLQRAHADLRVLAGVALLGESVGPLFGAAVALVAAGLWLVNRPDGGQGGAARTA
jgi:drug/metabolite transporter (DMT)-like permease